MISKFCKILVSLIVFIFSLIFLFPTFVAAQETAVPPDPYYQERQLQGEAITEKDVSKCQQLKILSSDECILSLALTNNEAVFCPQITDLAIRDDCIQKIVLRQAIASGLAGQCKTVVAQRFQSQCLTEIFRKQTVLVYCDDFTGQEKAMCQDNVISNQAIEQVNIAMCDQIQDQVIKLNCQVVVNGTAIERPGTSLTDAMPVDLVAGQAPAETETPAAWFTTLKNILLLVVGLGMVLVVIIIALLLLKNKKKPIVK